MQTPEEEIIKAWSLLDLGQGGGELTVPSVALPVDCGFGPVRVALTESRLRRLLVPVGEASRVSQEMSTEGLAIGVERLLVKGRLVRFIDVACLFPELYDVFTSLIGDILTRLSSGTAPAAAVQQVVQEYRQLLGRPREPIGLEKIIGLLGELAVLERLLQYSDIQIDAWTGPFGSRHDFNGSHRAIEVKSTIRQRAAVVQITSLDQMLEPEEGGELFLWHVAFERSGSGGHSLTDALGRISALTGDLPRFVEALAHLGIDDWRSRPELSREQFRIAHEAVYRVGPGFPRIIPASFPGGAPQNGIVEIRYGIDLAHAAVFRLDENSTVQLLKEMSR